MQESVKEHFENRSQARAGSRITTDRYSKLAPKAQVSRGSLGVCFPRKLY